MASVYKKHTHREHILELPDTYVGSVETIDDSRWVYNVENGKMEYKNLKFNPGLYKIFDEVLVNARDAMVRSGNVKHIDVSCAFENDINKMKKTTNNKLFFILTIYKKQLWYTKHLTHV